FAPPPSFQLDALDAPRQRVLPVAAGAAIALAPLHLEDLDLGAAHPVDDDAGNAGVGECRGADLGAALAADHEDAVERDLAYFLAGDGLPLDVDDVAALDAVLLTA